MTGDVDILRTLHFSNSFNKHVRRTVLTWSLWGSLGLTLIQWEPLGLTWILESEYDADDINCSRI